MISARLPALALIAVLAGASAASAQQPPAPQGLVAHKGWDPAQMRARMEARHTARLRALHDVLAIRPDQEAAFAAFAEASRRPERAPGAGHDAKGSDHAAMAAMTTPERLDSMARRMQEHMARRQEMFQRRAAATKALYAALGPEQRRTLDALPMLRGGGGRGGWGKGDRHMGGHGMDGHGEGGGEG